MKRICLWCMFLFALASHASAQKIVVDSSFSNNYLKTPTNSVATQKQNEDKVESFGDLVTKIGDGIWTRLKYRLNLEGLQEGIENKKEQYASKKEDGKEG